MALVSHKSEKTLFNSFCVLLPFWLLTIFAILIGVFPPIQPSSSSSAGFMMATFDHPLWSLINTVGFLAVLFSIIDTALQLIKHRKDSKTTMKVFQQSLLYYVSIVFQLILHSSLISYFS